MSNSPLVVYTQLSPNHSGQRTHNKDRISPHCVVGQCSLQTLGNIFASPSRQASCNYGLDPQGKVGMYVEECNRSWCTSSSANDQRAVTIEVASDTTEPYAITAAAYEGLIALMTDICQRNGKTKILWLGDKTKTLAYEPKANEMVITVHRWFANKSCPGTYIYERLGQIAEEVNKRLGNGAAPQPTTGTATPEAPKYPAVPFLAKVIVPDLNYRSEPSMSGAVRGQTGKGTFTIVEVKDGWGKLKSGAGWIYLENPSYVTIGASTAGSTPAPTQPTFKAGDKVRCKPGVTTFYNGQKMASWVPSSTLYVRAVESDGKILLVSTEPTKAVYTGRVNAADMQKI